MKMLCFKFNQNRTINEEFDFFKKGKEEPLGGRGGEGPPKGRGPLFINLDLDYYW